MPNPVVIGMTPEQVQMAANMALAREQMDMMQQSQAFNQQAALQQLQLDYSSHELARMNARRTHEFQMETLVGQAAARDLQRQLSEEERASARDLTELSIAAQRGEGELDRTSRARESAADREALAARDRAEAERAVAVASTQHENRMAEATYADKMETNRLRLEADLQGEVRGEADEDWSFDSASGFAYRRDPGTGGIVMQPIPVPIFRDGEPVLDTDGNQTYTTLDKINNTASPRDILRTLESLSRSLNLDPTTRRVLLEYLAQETGIDIGSLTEPGTGGGSGDNGSAVSRWFLPGGGDQ